MYPLYARVAVSRVVCHVDFLEQIQTAFWTIGSQSNRVQVGTGDLDAARLRGMSWLRVDVLLLVRRQRWFGVWLDVSITRVQRDRLLVDVCGRDPPQPFLGPPLAGYEAYHAPGTRHLSRQQTNTVLVAIPAAA